MKQYRLQPGTSSRIYYLLTVNDNGTMALEFHGTDRVLTEEASVNADGWIVTKDAMFPPIDHPNGRWQLLADGRCQMEDVTTFVPTTDLTGDTDSYSEPAESETTDFTNDTNNDAEQKNERLRQCNMTQNARESKTERTAVCSTEPAPSPKPRRAVRAQKPTPSPYERLYGAPAITVDHTEDHSDRNRKIFAAVATAAVFIVLVNTIGLFGIAALGLLAGGIIK